MGFLIRLLMRILDNGVSQEVNSSEGGKIILKMNKLYGIIGILSLIISVIFIIASFFSGAFFGDDAIYAFAIISFFFLCGLLLVLYSRNIMAEVTSDRIVYVGLTGKRKEIIWDQLKNMSFNTSSKEIILKSETAKIKLHIHLKGIGSLIKIIKQNVDVSIYAQTLQKLNLN